MTAGEFLVAGAASWSVLACGGGFAWSFVARRLKRKSTEAAEHVNWLPLLPPVPPSRREVDADWLDVWPVDGLSDDEVYVRFNRLMDVA